MSNFVDFVTPAVNFAKQASQHDEKEEFEEAYKLYLKASEFFVTAIKHEKQNPKKQEMLRKKCKEIMERAEAIKEYLDESAPESGGTATKKKSKGKGGKDDDDDTKKLQDNLSNSIVLDKPNVKWSDVAGLEGAKSALQEAVILPLQFPQLFLGKRKPWKGILLYGPPGTGKSYLAKAVATEADSTFFSMSSADLVSKWQGESEKMVKNLFAMARAQKPSIIFIDEIDSLCSARSDSENDATRRIKTQFLVEMQGVGKEEEGVLVLGATNLPWALDRAVLRRFERRILIPLPDKEARIALFKLSIGDTPHSLDGNQIRKLALMTDGFSGSDINVLVRNAIMEPVRKCQTATHFKIVSGPDPTNPSVIQHDLFTPCSPGDPKGQPKSLRDIPGNKLLPPVVTFKDFEKSIRTTKSSINRDDLKKFDSWTNEYGSDGNQ